MSDNDIFYLMEDNTIGSDPDEDVLGMLERRGIITVDPVDANTCCGIERDDDGFCQHRPRHPIYIGF